MIITSPLLSRFDGLLHNFGTRAKDPLQEGVVIAKQVHGNHVLFLEQQPHERPEGSDALVTDQKGIAIGVTTADCLPILLVEPSLRLIAAVHAGWRGTLARIVQKTVEEMVRRGGRADRIAGALGPCMQGSCYEVGPEVYEAFEVEFSYLDFFKRPTKEKKWRLDLPEANRFQLREAGIRPEQIDPIDLCTHCRPDLFYSYRREGTGCGKMVSHIQIVRSY